jgi:hypothetical protein
MTWSYVCLAVQRDPHAVQPHMQKCFDAIKKLRFGEGRQVRWHQHLQI